MKKIISSLVLLTLVGCSDVIETEYNNADEKANITFYVTGAENSEALSDVKIYLITENPEKSTMTDSNGVLVKKDFKLGNSYTFKIEADGYTKQTKAVTISNASGNADYAIAGDVTTSIVLYKLDATVSGSLFVDEDGIKVPAKDAKVKAYISCGSCDVDFVETTVKSDGTYSFENLPSNLTITVEAQSFTLNGIKYATKNLGSTSPTSGEEVFMSSVGEYTTASTQALEPLVDDLGSVASDEAVVIEFTQPVNTSKIGYNDITVNNGINLAVDVAWNSTKTKATITPSIGEWEANDNFTVSFDLESEGGDTYSGSVNWDTNEELVAFSNLKFATVFNPVAVEFTKIQDDKITVLGSHDVITLKWDTIPGTSNYQIYYMADDDATLQYWTSTTNTTYNTGLAKGDADLDEGPAYYQIWAQNGKDVVKSNIIKIRE